MKTLDCLSIKNSPSVQDLKFFSSLTNVIGKTWNYEKLSDDKFRWSEVDCFSQDPKGGKNGTERIKIQKNPNLKTLFSAKTGVKLANNVRMIIELENCTLTTDQDDNKNKCEG